MEMMTNKTRWFFLLPSSQEAEERHIYDIAFGVKCLLSRNISLSDIVFVIDNASSVKVSAVFSKMQLSEPSEIFSTKQIDTLLCSNTYKNAVVFVTGHGSSAGLDSNIPIKPYCLYKKFQISPNFKRVVFYFGQCYSGIFNQMPLSNHLSLPKSEHNNHCNIVAIGGTGLFPSISAPVTCNDVTWSANIFLVSVFNWILEPKDIDGDEKFSVMDSFKSAAIDTNAELIEIKKRDNIQNFQQQAKLFSLIGKLKTGSVSHTEKENVLLEIQALERMLAIHYVVQEPWILNANIAISTFFER